MKPQLKKITLLSIFLWCGFMQDRLHRITAINIKIEEAQSKLIKILEAENKQPQQERGLGDVFMISQAPAQ